jgi:succinyl-CoA synthetase alpha subunit
MLAATFDGTMASVTPDTFVELYRGRLLPPGTLEHGVDLVVIDVPAAELGDALTQCAAHDAGVVVVMSGGFVDRGEQGRAEERRLARFARRHGMRVVGPDSLGVANTDPAVGLYLLSDALAPPGGGPVRVGSGTVGVFAHSPDLSRDVLAALAERSLGISSFVSAGDKADISGNDLLEYWEDDEATAVVVLAVESFGNPRRFARLVERVGQTKPIIILAPDEPETEALCRRTGVVRAETLAAMAQTAATFALHPEWFHPPAPNEVVLPVMTSEALAAAGAALADVGVGVLHGDALTAVVSAVGLDGWSGPPATTTVCGRQDHRFGPIVEMLDTTGRRVVALAPLTTADLAGLAGDSAALHDVLVRVGAAISGLPDLAEIRVHLTVHDTPAAITAIAAPSPNGTTQIVRRLT